MKYILAILFILLSVGLVTAQDDLPIIVTVLAVIQDAKDNDAIQLDLSNLGLDELPPEIGELISLEYLILDNNNLVTLPDSLSNLKNLRHLSLNNNKFSTLPDSLVDLQDLCVLELKDNDFIMLPSFLAQMEGLVDNESDSCRGDGLIIGRNPLLMPSEYINGSVRTPQIMTYIRNPMMWHIKRYGTYFVLAITGIAIIGFLLVGSRRRPKRKRKDKVNA